MAAPDVAGRCPAAHGPVQTVVAEHCTAPLSAHGREVRDDFMSGVRSGVNGPPTFIHFINGVCYDGSHDLHSLLAAVRSAT